MSLVVRDERPRFQRRPIGRALGQVIREARKAAGLTQVAVAQRVGVDDRYVSLLERGRRAPSIAIVFAIARALRVAPEEIVRRTRLLLGKQRRQGLESRAWHQRNPILPQWKL